MVEFGFLDAVGGGSVYEEGGEGGKGEKGKRGMM